MSGIFTTRANGEDGCAKSASECVGCACGAMAGVGGKALLPDMKLSLGFGPRIEDVIWLARGLRKISRSKKALVRGGSCWIFLSQIWISNSS
jgi:hypothetical protein